MNSEPKHEGWDAYWSFNAAGSHRVYALLASIYRRIFICHRLSYWLSRAFPDGANLLHAGCGGGEVDALVSKRFRITALDISRNALELYGKNNPHNAGLVHADLLAEPWETEAFDGVYHLGVLEHFETPELVRLVSNLRKMTRRGGKMVAFWPLHNAPSVKFLGLCHKLLNRAGDSQVSLHPPEVNLIASEIEACRMLEDGGWKVLSYDVSPADLYIQAVILCERNN